MKKSIALILAVLLSISLLFAGCGKKDNNDDNDVTDVNLTGDIHQANEIEEEDSSVVNTKNAVDVDAFVSGKFYLEGTMYTDDAQTGMNVNIAMNGQEEFQMTTTLSGLYLGIYKATDGNYYIINPANSTYIVLDDSVSKFLGISDMNSFDVDFESAKEDEVSTVYYAVKINGTDGVCTKVTNKDNSYINLYTIGDRLCQVDSFEADGKLSSRIVVSSISSAIPSNQLTLAGLTKSSSLVKFFSGLQG